MVQAGKMSCCTVKALHLDTPCQVGSVVSVSPSHAVGRGFAPPPGRVILKTIIKMVQTASLPGTQCVKVGV